MIVSSIAVEQACARFNWSDEVGHATGHAALAIPTVALIAAAVRAWPPPRPTLSARRARSLIVLGMTLIAIGQGLESLGAFAYSGDDRVRPTLALAHDAGIIAGPLGMLIIAVGVAVVLHRPSTTVGIADAAVIVVGMIGIAGLFIGIPAPLALLLVLGTASIMVFRIRRGRAPTTSPSQD